MSYGDLGGGLESFPNEIESLLEHRVRALALVALSDASRRVDDHCEEILRFWVENRLAGWFCSTAPRVRPMRNYGERFVEQLVFATLAQIRATHPRRARERGRALRAHPHLREHLAQMAAFLAEHESERALRKVIEGFWSYQRPGLRSFATWTTSFIPAR